MQLCFEVSFFVNWDLFKLKTRLELVIIAKEYWKTGVGNLGSGSLQIKYINLIVRNS